MKLNIFLIAIAGLSFAACNNKVTPNVSVAAADSVSRITGDKIENEDHDLVMREDSSFLATASQMGTFEIEAAKIARKNSQNADVNAFADMMISEHTAMRKDVEVAAVNENIAIPVGMGDDNKKEWDKLLDLKGDKFDKEYIHVNIKGHREAIDLFEKTSKNTSCSPQVRNLATSALPKLKTHKEHAEAVKSKLKM